MTFQPVQLKVCEGCGSLWFRSSGLLEVYCGGCVTKLADFPRVGMMRRPGRKRAMTQALQGGVQ